MKDYVIIFLIDMFNKLEAEGKDGFMLLNLTVPLHSFYRLYELLSCVDVMPIEMIPDDEKQKYWAIAKRYHTDKATAIKASKAAYVLTLITNY